MSESFNGANEWRESHFKQTHPDKKTAISPLTLTSSFASHFLVTVLLLDIQRAPIAMATTEPLCADVQPGVILSAHLCVRLSDVSLWCPRWSKINLAMSHHCKHYKGGEKKKK